MLATDPPFDTGHDQSSKRPEQKKPIFKKDTPDGLSPLKREMAKKKANKLQKRIENGTIPHQRWQGVIEAINHIGSSLQDYEQMVRWVHHLVKQNTAGNELTEAAEKVLRLNAALAGDTAHYMRKLDDLTKSVASANNGILPTVNALVDENVYPEFYAAYEAVMDLGENINHVLRATAESITTTLTSNNYLIPQAGK